MSHIVEYIRLFRKPQAPVIPKTDFGSGSGIEMCNEEEEESRVTLIIHARMISPVSAPSPNNTELQLFLSIKKLSLYFTAKAAAFVVCSVDAFRFDLLNRFDSSRIQMILEKTRLGTGELDTRKNLLEIERIPIFS